MANISDSYYTHYLSSQDLLHHIDSDYMTEDDAGLSDQDPLEPGKHSLDYPKDVFTYDTDNMFKDSPPRKKLDYAEMYDDIYKVSSCKRHKVAKFRKGDWVDICTNDARHPFPLNLPDQRVGVVYDAMGNGWYMVKTLRGDYVPLYEGDSEMDCELYLIDLDRLYAKSLANKTASKDQQNWIKRLLMVMRMYGENLHELGDIAIDENKQTYLEQNYEYPA